MANQNLTDRLNAGVAAVVVPGTSDGLVSKNGVPGNTTGSAIAAGYVGQELTFSVSGVSWAASDTDQNLITFQLPIGVWMVFGYTSVNSGGTFTAASNNRTSYCVSTTSAGQESPNANVPLTTGGASAGLHAGMAPMRVIVSTNASTNYYLVHRISYASNSGGAIAGNVYAVRIG